MVARWLQQKQTKQKKMRRAWAKSYSMKRTGIVAAPTFINDQGQPVDASLGARNRAANGDIARVVRDRNGTLNLVGGVPEHVKTRLNRDHNPLRIETPESIFKEILRGNPRAVALAKSKEVGQVPHPKTIQLTQLIQSTDNAGSLQKEHGFCCQKLTDGKYTKLWLYMSGEVNFFVEGYKTRSTEIWKRSIFYKGRHKAMSAYNEDRIIWVERQELPTGST